MGYLFKDNQIKYYFGHKFEKYQIIKCCDKYLYLERPLRNAFWKPICII